MTRWKSITLVVAGLIVAGTAAGAVMSGNTARDWRTASHEPVGLAPDPATTPEAVVQVYAARAWGWRGYFGVHSWIAVKPANAAGFTVYELIGWRLRWGDSAVAVRNRDADARWFGAEPDLLADLRGDGVDEIIRDIDAASQSYPYAARYRAWPGPNSNTYTAHIAREVPALKLDLPPTAIGKDFLGSRIISKPPSGSGFQFNLFGVFGVLAGIEEGLEFNLLGLTFGVDATDPALKLPFAGRIGSNGPASPRIIEAPDRQSESSL